jgi:GAF domain-containing protein
VLETGRAFAVPDARADGSVLAGRADRLGFASALFVPVAWQGAVRNVVFLAWNTRRAITSEEIDTAQLVADQAAAGYARLEAEERRSAGSAQDRAVVRAARTLGRSLDLQEILETLVEEVAIAMDADTAGVYLVDREQGGAIATAGYKMPPTWVGPSSATTTSC